MTDKAVFNLSWEKVRALLLLVLTALLWSSGGLLIKSVNWNPLAIAGVRSAIAALILLAALRKPKITWSRAQIGGAFAYAAMVVMLVTATKLTTAANAILLQYTAPVYVGLFGAWILKERTRFLDWITIIAILGGMVLFFLDHLSIQGVMGNLAGAASGISFAAFTIFMRMQKNGSPLETVLLGNILTAIIGLPFMFQSTPDMYGWINLALLGVFQLGISYILYSIAIKYVTALESILIAMLEPILNPVWVFLQLGEAPGQMAMIGGFIVLAAVTIRFVMQALWSDNQAEKEAAGQFSSAD